MPHNPVHWFELPATDLNRAKKFYEHVFGFEMAHQANAGYDMMWFPSNREGFGISGALVKGMGYVPSLIGPIIYFSTASIDEVVVKIEKAGGKIHVPKKDIGEYGYIAIFEDSEGNRVGLHQMK